MKAKTKHCKKANVDYIKKGIKLLIIRKYSQLTMESKINIVEWVNWSTGKYDNEDFIT